MNKLIFLLLGIIPNQIIAQNVGIKFEQASWKQITAKAMAEHKYIFVDCFATWCGPCKKMDREVYIDDTVGNFFNHLFISIKVQMDSTDQDNNYIKQWRQNAQQFMRQYNVDVLPTYLFFSPEGKLVHRENGVISKADFIRLANDAIDSSKQIYTVVESYKEGKRDYVNMANWARAAKKIGDAELSKRIALDYYNNYISKMDDVNLFTKDNIKFVCDDFYFLYASEKSSGRLFKYFFEYPLKVDSLMGVGFSDRYIRSTILREEVIPKATTAEGKPVEIEPNWQSIKTAINKKFGAKYGESIVSDYQANYYLLVENWRAWADLFTMRMKTSPPSAEGKNLHPWGDVWALNHLAWKVFLHCNDKRVLKVALRWSNLSIKLCKSNTRKFIPYLDTRANLLYKLGKVSRAIKQEENAMAMDVKTARKLGRNDGSFVKMFLETIRKMKEGKPTWPQKK